MKKIPKFYIFSSYGNVLEEKEVDSLLDVKDVARILGLKVSTIYKYSMAGKLPMVKIHGNLRFREDQLEAYIKENSVDPVSIDA